MMKKHTRPNPQKNVSGRHSGARGADQALEPAGGLPELQRADPHRIASQRRRRPAVLQEVRNGDLAMAARLKEQYQKEVRKKIQDEFGIKNIMAVPKIEKIVLNMGIGEAISEHEGSRQRRRGAGPDRRTEAGHHQGQEVDRQLQAARRRSHRHDGHSARREDVRVSRPADQHRAAARPRFPRRSPRSPSTAAATTPSASAITSSFRRSMSPRSTSRRG